uniref:Uncharacterized protein n=1 Tax=Arundo donax TaxID=35708 RepID=A0A0A9DAI0_ARUDO
MLCSSNGHRRACCRQSSSDQPCSCQIKPESIHYPQSRFSSFRGGISCSYFSTLLPTFLTSPVAHCSWHSEPISNNWVEELEGEPQRLPMSGRVWDRDSRAEMSKKEEERRKGKTDTWALHS